MDDSSLLPPLSWEGYPWAFAHGCLQLIFCPYLLFLVTSSTATIDVDVIRRF